MEAIKAIQEAHPGAQQELEMLWRKYQSEESLPKLTAAQIAKIEGMFFGWKYLKLVRVDQRVATRAVELARDRNLRPADSIHAASALVAKASILQAWDRDYGKVKDLIDVGEPEYITPAGPLLEGVTVGPTPEDFTDTEKDKQKTYEKSKIK